MDVEYAGPVDLITRNSNLQDLVSDGEDFAAGLEKITGDKERIDVAVVASKGSEYIEALIADDEWMQLSTKEEALQLLAEGAAEEISIRGEGGAEIRAANHFRPTLPDRHVHPPLVNAYRSAGSRNRTRHPSQCEFLLLLKNSLAALLQTKSTTVVSAPVTPQT